MNIEDVKNTRDLWKYERERAKENKKKPNGFSYFKLGFSSCAALISIVVLILKLVLR